MATFAKSTFNALTYSTFRPSYPPSLLSTVLHYHHHPPAPSSSPAPKPTPSPQPHLQTALELGCGHGSIARSLSPHFSSIYATDPSAKMLSQARAETPHSQYPNIEFHQTSAEDILSLPFLSSPSPSPTDPTTTTKINLLIATQAAHWFNFPSLWPILAATLAPNGTLAFVGYKDPVFPSFPAASRVFDEFCYGEGRGKMGMYWEMPGRGILRRLYRDIRPPGGTGTGDETGDWWDITRIVYEPVLKGANDSSSSSSSNNVLAPDETQGEVLIHKRLRLGEVEGYARTFSAYWNWMADHEGCAEGREGDGDVVDEMFRAMVSSEREWVRQAEGRVGGWRDVEVDVEWGSVVLLARRR